MNTFVFPPSSQPGKRDECDTITEGNVQGEEKQFDVERLEYEEEYSQPQKTQGEHEIKIPRVFLGPDPEFLPENQPPTEPYYWYGNVQNYVDFNKGGFVVYFLWCTCTIAIIAVRVL